MPENKLGYGNQYSVTKTFHQWCVENDRQDLEDRFDVERNQCTTDDIGYSSNRKVWLMCPRGLHDSEEHYVVNLTGGSPTSGRCRRCNSVAQILIDNNGEDYLWSRWGPNNEKSPWDVPARSTYKKISVICDKNREHVYEQAAVSFTKGIGCPYCSGHKVFPSDSVGAKYPFIVDRWSSKNTTTPFEILPHSDKKIWLKCPLGIHEDYLQKMSGAIHYDFRCPRCSKELQAEKQRGDKSRFWKGGISNKDDVLRHRMEYSQWRDMVYTCDNYICQCCGVRGAKLNAHHIYPFSAYENLRYDVDNGLTLCVECHDSTISGSFHNLYGTHNNTPEQLREYISNKGGIDIFETHSKILGLSSKIASLKE